MNFISKIIINLELGVWMCLLDAFKLNVVFVSVLIGIYEKYGIIH